MTETVVHPVYSGTALSSQERWRRGRKYGKYDFGNFERLQGPSCYLGRGNIGDIEVACRLLLDKSRWGVLSSDKNPGGVLYLDLNFAEPPGCRLRDATIVLTLNEEDHGLQVFNTEAGDSKTKIPVQITEYGPRHLQGPVHQALKIKKQSFSPSIDVGSFAGVGGIGRDSEKHYVQESRWTFSGLAMPNKSGRFTTLKWHLVKSKLDPQAVHATTFHTGLAFEHDGQPFLIQVEVYGNLESKAAMQRLRLFKFPVEAQYPTILVKFGGRNNPYRKPLDELAQNLPREMEVKNMIYVSEVPEQSISLYGEHYELSEEGELQETDLYSQPNPERMSISSSLVDREIEDIRREAMRYASPDSGSAIPVQWKWPGDI
ncbi:hypothetical protein F4821DRAFT_227140 [Hypoxylon rubiginosum]|uniref:Uncharacterized protein n=1 Tax=Hypoxylon rubiginosum TaxID=110542 RepID=A0ACC0DG68_9PEZI|nr:hypothetical protein F4821DRAFT_227140 [Hypoxylon rubiginosum]